MERLQKLADERGVELTATATATAGDIRVQPEDVGRG